MTARRQDNRGTLFLQQVGASAVYAIFTIIGDVVDGTGYRKLPVSHVMSRGTFTDGLAVAVSFARTGDKGLDGLGAGDTISDISSVTSGRLVKYSDPSGKHITDAGASIGTSGHSVPVLDANNTWSGAQSFDGGLSVPDAAFAYAKIQNVSATSRFLGRKNPGAASLEELTASDARTILNITEGAILGQPQGRLTLLSGAPVPYGATGSTTLYYTPYLGQLVPISTAPTGPCTTSVASFRKRSPTPPSPRPPPSRTHSTMCSCGTTAAPIASPAALHGPTTSRAALA